MCYGHAQVLAEQLHRALERIDEDGGGFQGVQISPLTVTLFTVTPRLQ